MSEPYENTMSIEQLRREVRDCWNKEHALADDLAELPEVPSIETMRLLVGAGMKQKWPDVWSLGKDIQQRHPWGTVPAKTEYECAVGLWSLMRAGILAVFPANKSDTSDIAKDKATTGENAAVANPLEKQ